MMALVATGSCGDPIPNMGYSLDTAGENRQELEGVLSYYGTQDRNVDKMKAAVFLISNMPFHYSYHGDSIHLYYDEAAAILSNKSLPPEVQRDSLLYLSQTVYKNLPSSIIPDNRVVTKDFLIHTIDLINNGKSLHGQASSLSTTIWNGCSHIRQQNSRNLIIGAIHSSVILETVSDIL